MRSPWKTFFALTLCTAILGCQQKTADEHHEHDATEEDVIENSENQALYNEVMKIHDEVMPKMNDIHTLKQDLKKKIEDTPNLPQAERIKLDATIARLDSAGECMMVWMREFEPLADSLVGEEKAREYLENEMERVKKVRENILSALEEAKQM
jgi:hypothetical protein